MPKAYWIAQVDVTDPERYQRYLAATAKAFAKYDVRFLARAGSARVMHGEGRDRNIVVEFPDFQTAVDFYNSPDYQFAIEERGDSALVDVTIVEGVEGS